MGDPLREFDPFDIFDAEAARLDRFFSSLRAEGWNRPSRCAGWSVRDMLGHLAGEELYNQACLDGELRGFFRALERDGVTGFDAFNDWCVRQRRTLPVSEVLREWRVENGETRARMRELGRAGTLQTSTGPYPVGLQAFHYASEYATHADDVGAPVAANELERRTWWRVQVARHVLTELEAKVRVELTAEQVAVHVDGVSARLSLTEFVAASVGRLPGGHGIDPRIAASVRCLA